MSVSIIAYELSVVEPYNLASAKTLLKHLLYLILSHRLIAMGSHKANARCENSSPTVALYRATLEHKVVIIHTLTLEHALMEQCAVDKIVLVGSKLLAPSIETEVEQAAWSRDIRRRNKRKEGMVACPSVVYMLTRLISSSLKLSSSCSRTRSGYLAATTSDSY